MFYELQAMAASAPHEILDGRSPGSLVDHLPVALEAVGAGAALSGHGLVAAIGVAAEMQDTL